MNDRAGAWFDAGLRYRLWFSEEDEHDGRSLPFSLCRRGDAVAAHNVSCGVIDGREVRLFDLDVLVRDDGSTTQARLKTWWPHCFTDRSRTTVLRVTG